MSFIHVMIALFLMGSLGISSVWGQSVYTVSRIKKPIRIDGNWDKKEWKKVSAVAIALPMGKVPDFIPKTYAKLAYDNDNLYLIFKVEDRYLKSTVTEYNGNVSGDSCVEFFFSPDEDEPLRYFNLEVNAGGTPLIFYVTKPWTEFVKLDPENISKIEIAHSMPAVIDPEIVKDTTWTIECRIPFTVLEKYGKVTKPAKGVKWKANFYKTGSRTSNPHWFTWSKVDFPRPNFHLPEFFGTIVFK